MPVSSHTRSAKLSYVYAGIFMGPINRLCLHVYVLAAGLVQSVRYIYSILKCCFWRRDDRRKRRGHCRKLQMPWCTKWPSNVSQ